MSVLQVEPVAGDLPFGARITGVTRDNVRDPEIRGEIDGLFEARGVLVFAEVEPSSEMQVALGEVLGPLRNHAMKAVPRADVGAPATLMELHTDPAGPNLFEVDGKVLSGCTPWHFDACYAPQLYRGGLLRALEITSEGGETGFADGIQLYQAISPELRARFDSLDIVYHPALMHDRQRFGLPSGYRILETAPATRSFIEAYADAPRSIHPAVWRRKTGERVLHVSPWQAAGVEGHEDPEGDALLEALCQEMYAKMTPYWHKWAPTDMVAWDNWRMLHAVSGHDPRQGRRVHRATIDGDYGLGRAEDTAGREAPARRL